MDCFGLYENAPWLLWLCLLLAARARSSFSTIAFSLLHTASMASSTGCGRHLMFYQLPFHQLFSYKTTTRVHPLVGPRARTLLCIHERERGKHMHTLNSLPFPSSSMSISANSGYVRPPFSSLKRFEIFRISVRRRTVRIIRPASIIPINDQPKQTATMTGHALNRRSVCSSCSLL